VRVGFHRVLRLAVILLILVLGFAATASTSEAETFTFSNTNANGSLSGSYPAFTLTGGNNNSGASGTSTYTATFSAATVVTFTWNYVTQDSDGPSFDRAGYVLNGTFNRLSTNVGTTQSGSASVTVPAGSTFGWYVQTTDNRFGPASVSVTATTHPYIDPATTALSKIQQTASRLEGQTSQASINGILDSVIEGSLDSGFSQFTASADGVAMMVAPGQQAGSTSSPDLSNARSSNGVGDSVAMNVARNQRGVITPVADVPQVFSDSPWRMFAAGRYSLATGTDNGNQFNGLFGFSYRLGETSAAGLFGGYETFDYTDATPSRFTGHGGTLGVYVAGNFEELKLDARAYGTLLNYDLSTAGAFGSTNAQRLGTTVTASYDLNAGALAFTPFVRGSGLFEWQSAYIDSVGGVHAAQGISEGVIAPGLRITHHGTLADGTTFKPYLAGEADIAFGNGILAGFNDAQGLSGKVSAGFNCITAHGVSFGVDGSYGGIGSTIQTETLQASLSLPL